jgi:hypothetical protein
LTYRVDWQDRWDEKPFWERDRVFEASGQQPQAEPKETQITAILPVELFQPAVA